MILPDANLLVLAHRSEMPGHAEARAWLQSVLDGDAAFGMSELVSGVLRVITNPRSSAIQRRHPRQSPSSS